MDQSQHRNRLKSFDRIDQQKGFHQQPLPLHRRDIVRNPHLLGRLSTTTIPNQLPPFPFLTLLPRRRRCAKRWMARANKYTSVNFNDIYEKKFCTTTSSPSPSASSNIARPNKSYSHSASSRLQGGMLVLSRPSPKLPSQPPPPPSSPSLSQHHPQLQPPPQQSGQSLFDSDLGISLRPLGRTGSGPPLTPPSFDREKEAYPPVSPPPTKSDKFVPPHLRPGFVAREAKPVQPEFQRHGGGGGGGGGGGRGRTMELGNINYGSGSSGTNRENRRPKSGGGYEKATRRGGESDILGEVDRP